jgi:hypothetical protein
MTHSIKAIFILSISVILTLFSCSKSNDEAATIITYKLTLKATLPTSGSTTFTTISYKKADGTIASRSNTNTSFLESFTISDGYNIFFNVAGTNNSTTLPLLNINYTVEKYENNVFKGLICFGSSVSESGSAGAWTFNANFNSIFNGDSCQ